jgi:hypothetical protein
VAKIFKFFGNSKAEQDSVILTIGTEDITIIERTEIEGSIALEKALAAEGMTKQKDLMYVRFALAHEGTNKNRDHFNRSELKAATKTPVLKAINWEHGEPVIGTIYRSRYLEVEDPSFASASKDGKRGRIECEAVIWKYRYPAHAKDMLERYKEGKLKFSMETYFSKCTCTECGEIFQSKEHSEGTYCDHLNYRKTPGLEAKAARSLQGNVFGGAGVVGNPADVDAGALAIAKESSRKEGSSVAETKTFTQAELDSAVEKAADEAIAKLKKGKELEKAKADVEDLAAKLEEAATKIRTAEQERDDAKAEVETIKNDIAKAKAVAGRMKELASAGYVMPEGEENIKSFRETVAELTDNGFKLLLDSVTPVSEEVTEETPENTEETPEPAEASVVVPAGSATAKKGTKLDALNELIGAFMDDPTQ